MQLSFFPELFPDEPVYSLVARYHDSLGYRSFRDTIEELFGCRFMKAEIDLPNRLASLIDRMPWTPWTSEELILRHTAAPYYSFLLTPERQAQLHAALKFAPPPSGQAVLGLMARKVKGHSALRFCARCVEDDRRMHGTAYWHRVHQLPGIVICPRHGCATSPSQVSRNTPRTRNAFITLENALLGLPELPNADPVHDELLRVVAHDAAWLLDGPIAPTDHARMKALVRARLSTMGWLTPRGGIRARTVRAAWVERYPHDLLAQLACGLDQVTDPALYMAKLVKPEPLYLHPVLLILLIRLLGLSPAELTSEAVHLTRTHSRTPMRFRCINSLCPDAHTGHRTIHRALPGPGEEFEVECLRCGMTYRRRADPKTPNRIRTRGALWDATLRQLARDRASLREAAKKLGVEPLTVKRHAVRLGIDAPWTAPPQRPLATPRLTAPSQRARWKTLRKAYPRATRSELRAREPALWAWLHRHDKDWFTAHQPPRQQHASQRTRVDWEARDRQLFLELIACARDILQNPGRPIRITRAELQRRASKPDLFNSSLIGKLPRSARVARRLVESRKQFALRRIQWCVGTYRAEGDLPARWQLVRRAALRHDMELKCADALDAAIEALHRPAGYDTELFRSGNR